MKARVVAKIKNSPIFPVKQLTAEVVMEFDDDDNVFSRLAKVRAYFYKTYRIDKFMDCEIITVDWLE